MMRHKIEDRLSILTKEYQKGQERMTLLEQELEGVKSSMLRISGAIQVLQELLEEQTTTPAETSASEAPFSMSEVAENNS